MCGRGRTRLAVAAIAACVLACLGGVQAGATGSRALRIARVVDGDTVYLTNGARVRLVQIDTPEVYFGVECWGRRASAETKKLLPPGTRVRLTPEPATDSIDAYGRLLRYVIRARDGLNVNVFLVAHGDAAPYFYEGRRGRYAGALTRLALRARAEHRGLWGACRGTSVDFDHGVDTGRT